MNSNKLPFQQTRFEVLTPSTDEVTNVSIGTIVKIIKRHS